VIHVACFSGGKDSTAVLLWLRDRGVEFIPLFLDTGWEHPITYAYLAEVNRTLLDGKLVTVRSTEYRGGFAELVVKRQIVPGVHSRFCTEELKVVPLWRFIESLDDEVTVYQGIRAEESQARADLPPRQWANEAGGYWIERPLFDWTHQQVFALLKQHGVPPNPLYLLGARRVGCWPCIMVSKAELKALLRGTPGLQHRLEQLEAELNAGRPASEYRSFFRSDYIPERFCSLRIVTKDGRTMVAPTAADVCSYLEETDAQQLALFAEPPSRCLSVYNLCE